MIQLLNSGETRRNPNGFYNHLQQRERTKLKGAQSWLNDPTSPDVPNIQRHDAMEDDPDLTNDPTLGENSQSGSNNQIPNCANRASSQQQSQENSGQTDPMISRPHTTAGASPLYKDTSQDGKRRFITFVLSSTDGWVQALQNFSQTCAKKQGNGDMTSQQ